MGNQGLGSAIALGAGIAAGAAVIVLSGGTLTPAVVLYAGLAFSAASIAAGIGASMLLGSPQSNDSKSATAQNLQIANANESYPIPVIFGTQRLAGNYLRYDKDEFDNKKITQEVESGKGGMSGGGANSQVTGFEYFLSWEYGLCMGRVDRIISVVSNPGEMTCFDNERNIDEDNGEELTLKTKSGDENGDVILYPGAANQDRVGGANDPYDGDGMNYKHVCWVLFKKKFKIGLQPTPKSYVFELTRWPDVTGTTIKKRGSALEADEAWYSANPAAILYEIFTNKVWGRGLNPDLIDQPSFTAVSQYFEDKKIGMSFTLDGQATLSDTIDSIRLHVNTIVYWTAGKLYCRCLMDTTNSYATLITIDKNQITGEPELTRPLWSATYNELRCEFVNRKNRYQNETVFVQDLANIDSVGIINSKKIGLRGFVDRKTAQLQAHRILREISYPAATLRLYMNRFASKMLPGDFVKFIWEEWSAGKVTSYWRVASITDENQDDRGLEVVLVEDQFKPFKEGDEDDFANPIEAWADTEAVGDEAEKNEDAYIPFAAGTLTPILVRDLNIIMTGYSSRYAVFAQRRSRAAISLNIYLGAEGSGTFDDMGDIPCWAITGLLTQILPVTRKIDRASTVTGTLNHVDDLADLLEAASIVTIDADSFDILTKRRQALFIIDNEVIQVGYATEAAGVVTFRNMIRGVYGTEIESHANGSTFAFIPLFTPSEYTQRYTSDQAGFALDWQGMGVTRDGLDETSVAAFELPETHHKLKHRGLRPFPPEVISKSIDGANWKVIVRPRFHHKGAGIGSFEESLDSESTSLDGYTFPIVPNSGTAIIMPDDTILKEGTGKVELYYPSAGVTEFKVYASFGGKRSETYNTI